MNLIHLKYAVVIADTGSMTKAAEKLFTAQPNLSRAVRELEADLGITIFKRTTKGISPTVEGTEFLSYARKILSQVDAIEELYRGGMKKQTSFSISVPRASYISCAFTEFIKEINQDSAAELFYKETNALRAINNILNSDYRLGIIRYQDIYEDNFKNLLREKRLKSEIVFEFKYLLLFSAMHPLAKKENITVEDLTPYMEIAHADPFVPSMSLSTVRKNEIRGDVNKHIYVFERGSQMDMLIESPNTFMWASPVPERILQSYGLVQRECPGSDKVYRDVLIYRKGYILTDTDKAFIDKLTQVKKEIEGIKSI